MLKSVVPLLSTHNGPSYLLHAVEVLAGLGVPQSQARFVPVIGWQAGSEIEPYYRHSNIAEQVKIDPRRLHLRLGVNVRGDNRLRAFLPLTAVGLLPQQEAMLWRRQGEDAAQGYRRAYRRLDELAPDWTNNETPAERLTRQLCAQFPELRDGGMPFEASSSRVLMVSRSENGPMPMRDWRERVNPYAQIRTDRLLEPSQPTATAQELVEVFLTQAMLAVATADMMGGFAYELKVEPHCRTIDVIIGADSDLREIVRWLQAYPHRPLTEVFYPERDDREKADWDAYFAALPDHDNVFETAPNLWTERDPAIIALFGDVRRQYNDGRWEPFTADEMLSLATRHLPDYVPHYPHQFAVTGGMNWEGILLSLIECWLGDETFSGAFLGITYDDLNLFTPEEQVTLCGLLMQRRDTLDQCSLFGTAMRMLADMGIETCVEEYRLEPVRLGKPLAQPGRTLALGGAAALHAPEMVVKIPLDRDRDERAWPIEQKIKVLARLFLPIHLPLKTIWRIDRPVLGKSTFLRRANAPEEAPAFRLS